MLEWVLKFNQYDLYSKSDSKPILAELKPFYDDLLRRVPPAHPRLVTPPSANRLTTHRPAP